MIDKLVFSLLKKNSLQECSTDELKNLAEQYPYFSTAQFLYACKLKAENHPLFQQQLQKTSLYFNNPLWLDLAIRYDEKDLSTAAAAFPVYEETNNDELVIENPQRRIAENEIQASETVSVEVKAETKKEISETGLVFEPYHTVDYFASQGIKQVQEIKPQDRFGQQLKSFTEWLKTIRRMQPQEIAALGDSRTEEKVIEMAVHSIEDRNVVTEAMAEVWIKQGHPEKAIDIYNKLSLLNPSKSSYFAGLIENLKHS